VASTVWRGYISFGLISIPVRLFRAARAERVPLRRLYRETVEPPPELADDEAPRAKKGEHRLRLVSGGREAERQDDSPEGADSPASVSILSPVVQQRVHKQSGEVVPEQNLVKGYEYEKNKFVALEKEDLKNLVPKTTTEMQIQEFVALDEIDPVYFETSYYVVPEEAAEKSYALLYLALQQSRLVAIAQFAMHTREHVVMLRSARKGILAHTMFYASEVRADEEFTADVEMVSKKELDLAKLLVSSLTAHFEPEKYRDSYREKLEALIAAKVKGAAEPKPPARMAASANAVVDIADALRRSLSALKAPPQKDSENRKPAGGTSPAAKKATRGHRS
jgi:DNA end-binding protein Ku